MIHSTRHSWPLSSESFLACHSYCDTRHPFFMVISEDSYCGAFNSGAVTTFSDELGLSRLGFEHPIFRMRGERSIRLHLYLRFKSFMSHWITPNIFCVGHLDNTLEKLKIFGMGWVGKDLSVFLPIKIHHLDFHCKALISHLPLILYSG